MKSAFRSFLIILIIFSFSGLSFAADKSVSREEFLKIVKELKNEINTLKSEKASRETELLNRISDLEKKEQVRQDTDIGILREDVEELSELMSVVEKKTMLDRIQVSAELRTRCDWFSYGSRQSYMNIPGSLTMLGQEVRLPDKKHYNEEVHALTNNRLRISFKADIADNMKFHARAVMYKNWWDDDSPSFPGEVWFNEGRVPSGNNLRIDRAYVDYFFKLHDKLPMAFTFGRLPVIDALPSNLREDRARQSSWPGIFFDNIMDGAALTFSLSELTGLPNSRFSLWYTRQVPDDDLQPYRKESLMEDWDVFMSHFETGIPRIDNSLFILAFVYVPEITPIDFRLAGSEPISVPKELGSFWKLSLYVQFERFMGSNFDWFAGFSYMETDASGDVAKWQVGPIVHTYGMMSDDGKGGNSARAWHVGLRYRLPFEFLNNAKFGIEYNTASKYMFGINAGAQDPLHKMDNRGAAWDFYYIQPLNKHLLMRFGYTVLDARYTGGEIFIGEPKRINSRITNTYVLMDAKF